MPNQKEATRRPREGRAFPARLPLTSNALGVLAAFLAGAIYLPALQFGWVWNDSLLLGTHGAGGAAAEGFRPFLSWVQRGEWLLGAGSPALFHFTNLLLHAIGTWLVFLLAEHLGVTAGIAFAAALLFGVHPVHVESVAYVTGRPAMMATVFSLAALLAARTPTLCGPEGCRSRAIGWAYALFAVAALTDASALVTPFLLLGLDRWGAVRVPASRRRVHYAGFFAIFVVALLLAWKAHGGGAPSSAEHGIPEGALAPALLLSLGAYLKLLVWPHPLNSMRSLAAGDVGAAASWAAVAACVAAAALFAWWRRSDAASRVGTLILAAGIVAALPWPGTPAVYVAERSAYLPAAGIVLLFASLLRWAVERFTAGRLVALLLSIGVVGWAAWATTARIPVWRDNFSLLQAATVADPTDPMPWLELARQRAATGDPRAALQALDEAAKRGPSLEEIPTRQALLWGSLGRWAEAEEAARRATRLRPDNALAWANLGDALTQQSKSAEALEASRRAVSLDSTRAPIWYNYGVSLAATQDLEGAAAAYRRALAIDSTSVEAWNNLGAIYGSGGRLAEAGECYAKAVALAPGSVRARMNLALAYLRQGDKRRAAEQQQAIQRMDVDAARRLADLFLQIDPTMKPPPGSKR